MTIIFRAAHRPREFTVLTTSIGNSRNNALGLSSTLLRTCGLYPDQYVLVEPATRDSDNNNTKDKRRTILTISECQTDDGSAYISNDALKNIGATDGDSITLLPLDGVQPVTKVAIGPIHAKEKVPRDIMDYVHPYFQSQRRPIHEKDCFNVPYKDRSIALQILGIENAEYGVVENDTKIILNDSHTDPTHRDFNEYLSSQEKELITDSVQPTSPSCFDLENAVCESGIQLIVGAPDQKLRAKNVSCGRGSFQLIGVVSDASLSAIIANLPYR